MMETAVAVFFSFCALCDSLLSRAYIKRVSRLGTRAYITLIYGDVNREGKIVEAIPSARVGEFLLSDNYFFIIRQREREKERHTYRLFLAIRVKMERRASGTENKRETIGIVKF